ncbi:DUF4350 domain-containing protein [Methanocaldococcus sp. 28A]
MNKYLKYVVLACIGVALLSLPIGVPTIKTFSDYSIFNTKWNGCSEFAKMVYKRGDIVPLISPYNTYDFSKMNGVLFIIGPNLDFSTYEIEKIKEFLNNGNTVVIADDFGTANEILKGLNLSMRISNSKVNDLFYYKNDNLIVTCKVKNFNGNVTLNVPAYINSNNGIILTSSVSVSNGKQKAYPIMVETNYSNGKIVIISDPDIFINGMYKFNSKFWKYFLEHINAGTYYFDEVHHAGFSPYDIGVVYLHSSVSKNKMFLIFFVIIVLGFLNESGLYVKIFNRLVRVLNRKNNKIDIKKIAEENNIEYEKLKEFIEMVRAGRKYGRKSIS